MFYYDKDPDRMMNAKKREIIEELHAEKARILQELSGVDKITLTRLRELITNYSRIERDLKTQYDKINGIIEVNADALDRFADALTKIDRLDAKPENHHNSDGLIDRMLSVCETYTKHFDEFVYGNTYTAWDEHCAPVGGFCELDCSSFINLLIRGVTFENSRYLMPENTPNPKFFNGFDGFEYRLANQICKILDEMNYTFEPAADFSNIEAGDVLFFSWDDKTGDEFHEKAHRKIDHVAMFLEKKNSDYYRTIQYEENTPAFIYDVNADYMRQCVRVARLPYRHFSTVNESLVNTDISFSVSDSATLGIIDLEKPMIAGKGYTVFFRGSVDTENCYFMLQGNTANGVKTLFSNYGESWDRANKNYKFYFVCPEGLSDYSKIRIGIGAPSGTPEERAADASQIKVYKGYLSEMPY